MENQLLSLSLHLISGPIKPQRFIFEFEMLKKLEMYKYQRTSNYFTNVHTKTRNELVRARTTWNKLELPETSWNHLE